VHTINDEKIIEIEKRRPARPVSVEALVRSENLMKVRDRHTAWQQASITADKNPSPANRHALSIAQDAHYEFQAQIIHEFAAVRGWLVAKHPFSVDQLKQARHARHFPADFGGFSYDCSSFDHPEWFRWPGKPYRPAAIAVHVYAKNFDACQVVADREGLNFEELPWSWYWPCETLAGVYTRGGT